MRLWIDTDVGDNPDDSVALWCARRSRDAELVGVSTVDGDVARRAEIARALVPGVDVYAGSPPPERVATVDVLVGIGPWTNIAALADADALPRRVVLMGGALAPIHYRGEWRRVEHNVGTDPRSAARLLGNVGNLIVVPLDATVRVVASEQEEEALVRAMPPLGAQLPVWRKEHGDLPLVLHDPTAVIVALEEQVARLESRRLLVEPDGVMTASVQGPLQHVVAHVHPHVVRRRVVALARRTTEGD